MLSKIYVLLAYWLDDSSGFITLYVTHVVYKGINRCLFDLHRICRRNAEIAAVRYEGCIFSSNGIGRSRP